MCIRDRLTPHQAAYRLLCCERILLLDVRDAEETEEFSLPRARNVPLCMLAERIASLAPDRSLPIFLCCDSGSRSRAATLDVYKRQPPARPSTS